MGPPYSAHCGVFPESLKKSSSTSPTVNYQGLRNINTSCNTTSNNNTLLCEIQQTKSALLASVTKSRDTHSSSNINQAPDLDAGSASKGSKYVSSYTNVFNNNMNSEPGSNAPHDRVQTSSMSAVIPGQHQNISDLSARSTENSPTAVPGVDCNVTECQFSAKLCGRYGSMPTHGMDCTEARRRNYSSSSLPLSLMTATIEEVDDGECMGNTYTKSTSRSHSYGGNVTPTTAISYRALRREARVSSTSSPPRTRRIGPSVSLVRSSSDSTNRLTSLRDVDIIGESFESRYPWQRDFGVQCEINNDSDMHPSLKRAMSGPAMYTYFRSLSMASTSSSCSSPPLTIRDLPPCHCSSGSLSDSIQRHQSSGVGDSGSFPFRQAAMHRGNNVSKATVACNNQDYSVLDKTRAGLLYSRRTDFKKKPRPSSVGAVDNIRYVHAVDRRGYVPH